MYKNIYTIAERKELIGETLKLLRKWKRMTQKEVAEKIGINTEAYATYERGRNEPPAEMLVRLSFLYNIPVDIIVQRDNQSKDIDSAKKQLDDFDTMIDDLKNRVISGDPKTRELFNGILEQLKNTNEKLSMLVEKNDK